MNAKRDYLVWDNHGCMPLRADDKSFLPALRRYRDAGFTVVSLNVGMDVTPWENNLRMLAQFRAWIREHNDLYVLAERVADVERAKSEGKLAICFDIEGGNALDGNIDMVQLYYDLGVRWMLIAYNKNNGLGGGCLDDDQGLTLFGRQVIEQMERTGMVICCSHTGHRSAMQVMERASKPVIFSHSNASTLWPHPRNISDELIRACAQTGGVVGVNGIGVFLDENEARTDSIVRQIDYIAQLVGPQYVGIGLDYVFDWQEMEDFARKNPSVFPAASGHGSTPKIIEPERTWQVVDSLERLGYKTNDLADILGGNHLRVAQRTWAA